MGGRGAWGNLLANRCKIRDRSRQISLSGSSEQVRAAVGSSKAGAEFQPCHGPSSTSCPGWAGTAPAPATGAKRGTANSCVSASFIRDLSRLMCQGCQLRRLPTHPAPGSRPCSDDPQLRGDEGLGGRGAGWGRAEVGTGEGVVSSSAPSARKLRCQRAAPFTRAPIQARSGAGMSLLAAEMKASSHPLPLFSRSFWAQRCLPYATNIPHS